MLIFSFSLPVLNLPPLRMRYGRYASRNSETKDSSTTSAGQGEDKRYGVRGPGTEPRWMGHGSPGRSLSRAPPAPPALHGATGRHCPSLGAAPRVDFAAAWPVRPTSADMAAREAASALQIVGPGTGERGSPNTVLTRVVSRKHELLTGRDAPCCGLGGSSQQVEEPPLLRQQNHRRHAVGASWRGE